MRAGAHSNTGYSIPQTDGEEKGWNGDADRFFISRATACRGHPVPFHKFGFVGQAADGPVGARGPTTARFVGPDDPYPLCRCATFPPDRGNRPIGPHSYGHFRRGRSKTGPFVAGNGTAGGSGTRPYGMTDPWCIVVGARFARPRAADSRPYLVGSKFTPFGTALRPSLTPLPCPSSPNHNHFGWGPPTAANSSYLTPNSQFHSAFLHSAFCIFHSRLQMALAA